MIIDFRAAHIHCIIWWGDRNLTIPSCIDERNSIFTDPMIIQIISVKLRYSITLLLLNLVNT